MESCDECYGASYFHIGRKGQRADETDLMFVLHKQNLDCKMPAFDNIGDLDRWTAAWLNVPTGERLADCMKRAGLDLEDVYITNIVKCIFDAFGNGGLPEETYGVCKKRQFDSQFIEFNPRKMIVFGLEAYFTLFPENHRHWRERDDFKAAVATVKDYHDVPCLVLHHPSAPFYRGPIFRQEIGDLMKDFVNL